LHFFIKSSNLEKIRDVLKKFEINKNVEKIKNLIFGRMMTMTGGMLINGFLKWKSLPEKRNILLEEKANSLENKLSNFINLHIRKQSFDRLLETVQEGINGRKDAVIYFIQKT